MVTFIDQHRDTYGVEPICAVLPIAPSTYFRRKAQQQDATKRSARTRRDDELRAAIQRVWDETRAGLRAAEGVAAAAARRRPRGPLHHRAADARRWGCKGVTRGRAWIDRPPGRTPRPTGRRDLVDRQFTAMRPNQLWVADFTYVATWRGFVYVAFVIDVFARRIVGWRVSVVVGDRLRARCPRAGNLRPAQRRRPGPRASQRSRHAVSVDALHRSPRRRPASRRRSAAAAIPTTTPSPNR